MLAATSGASLLADMFESKAKIPERRVIREGIGATRQAGILYATSSFT